MCGMWVGMSYVISPQSLPTTLPFETTGFGSDCRTIRGHFLRRPPANCVYILYTCPYESHNEQVYILYTLYRLHRSRRHNSYGQITTNTRSLHAPTTPCTVYTDNATITARLTLYSTTNILLLESHSVCKASVEQIIS